LHFAPSAEKQRTVLDAVLKILPKYFSNPKQGNFAVAQTQTTEKRQQIRLTKLPGYTFRVSEKFSVKIGLHKLPSVLMTK
jgi:hypothetical protein